MNSSATVNVADVSIGTALRDSANRLRDVSDSARLDVELLLSSILRLSRTQLRTRDAQSLSIQQLRAFREIVSRRASGEPIAYILGEKEFWSLSLRITPAVLVPRPETELLVEWALECLQGSQAPTVVDLGTGSGAIALALASERADARVLAVDSSAEALALARENADSLKLSRVECWLGDWFSACAGQRFDLLVSNPPYVAEGDEHLQFLKQEPLRALISGADGLDAVRHLVAHAPEFLNVDGWLLLEHGVTQAAAVRSLLIARGYADVSTRRDLAGRERATGARWTRPA